MSKRKLEKEIAKAEKKTAKAAKKAEKQTKKANKKAAKQTKKQEKKQSKTQKKKQTDTSAAPTNTTNKKKKRRMKKKTRKNLSVLLILLLLLIAAAIAGIYLLNGYQNRNKFFQNVMINNMNVTGKTVAEVEAMLNEKTENYVLTIVQRDGSTVSISADDIDLKYISDGSVQKYFNQQRWWLWGLNYLKTDRDKYEVSIGIEYNEEKLDALMDSWTFTKAENQEYPVDAHLEYENGSFVVIDEFYGNRLDNKIFFEAVKEAIHSTQSELIIEDTGAYLNPTVFADDPVLNKNMEIANETVSCTITYTLPYGETNTVTPEMLLTWLPTDDEGYYYKDDAFLAEKIKTYVDELNKLVEAVDTKEVTFTGKLGEEQTVKNHRNIGWTIDTEKEIEQLTADIHAMQDVTREPVYSERLLTADGRIADTYVEIDMSAQHLWYFVDGEVVLESDIVSGTYSAKDRRTPEGLYQLAYKQRDRVLMGTPDENGEPSYQTPVSYWMPFNGSIGMHDASWRGSFGGTIYKYSGSHGCINMPTKKAKALYEIIEKGCPVVCYY